ncbi:hypothetical protein FSARC_10004 [Fusarium sarcochroum]|uniref:Xylanolytic transcriptional activator regulatory domain-containing protein n=1 Tax=Fusarium sarcochroum TaxID=1208366 RepID=A0A8H4TPQ3_9HYPO|nr:hypothetical protein FSARC_10004 [Fusarium sarcochroum]
MPASECMTVLKQQKVDLLQQYRSGVEHALLKANFLHSSDLLVLQALVVFLTFVRNSDNEPDMQTLTSLAVGNAMRMGLHCEEAASHLSTFEVEMRRRLWWQVYVLDVRIAMECGVAPNIIDQTFNTKKPLNISDSTLDPLADTLPQEVTGKTQMTLTLIRIQTSELTRQILFSDNFNKANGYPALSQAQKCVMIDAMQSMIETRHLVHYSSQIPLDIIASATARLLFAKLKVMVCRPQANQGRGNPFRENYLALCLEVLKESHMVKSYKSGRPWSWLFETCVEWDTLAYVLLDLCVAPSSTNSVATWSLVEDIYKEWQGDANLVDDRRWPHIEALWSEAATAKGKASGAQSPLASQSISSDAPNSSFSSAALLSTNEQHGYGLTVGTDASNEPEWFASRSPGTFDAISSVSGTEEDTPVSLSELPGAGTSCEWSVSLFEKYWQITE